MIFLNFESILEAYVIVDGLAKCLVVVVASSYGKSDFPDRGIAPFPASQQLFS